MLAVSAAIAGKAMMLAASANPVIMVFMVFLLMVLFSSLLRRSWIAPRVLLAVRRTAA
ncbi:hypothetical protein X751_26770 [Mesorhizobium sp. LNJC395A00]|nr:hypothetical protein X751_26770 [Mesorhizobium sp. LNJC395A00]